MGRRNILKSKQYRMLKLTTQHFFQKTIVKNEYVAVLLEMHTNNYKGRKKMLNKGLEKFL
jgi:hypothetical protein